VTVVVDLGCHHHPEHQGASQDSIARLIERYKPHTLYGFDPHSQLAAGVTVENGTEVYRVCEAAWIMDGETTYAEAGLSSSVGSGGDPVTCIDTARLIREVFEFYADDDVVLKADIQGSEYAVLEWLITTGAIKCVSYLLVEWHPVDGWEARKAAILERMTCPVEEWT